MRIKTLACALLTVALTCGIPLTGFADHHGPSEAPTPEAMIAMLPPGLQPAFSAGLAAKNAAAAAHQSGDPAALLAAELNMAQQIRNALVQTKAYLATASQDENDAIKQVLGFFTFHGAPGDMQPPGGTAPSPGMPPPGPGLDAMFVVDMMIAEADTRITALQWPTPPGSPPMGTPPPAGTPPGGTPPPMGTPPGAMNAPPTCSEELRLSEELPQAENVMASNGKQGSLLFRTVCGDTPGFDQVAISLPSGRSAVDFDVEAMTAGNVSFGIRVEGGADIYHSSMGPAAFPALALADVTPSATGRYTVYLDLSSSDPGSRVSVRFIDAPK